MSSDYTRPPVPQRLQDKNLRTPSTAREREQYGELLLKEHGIMPKTIRRKLTLSEQLGCNTVLTVFGIAIMLTVSYFHGEALAQDDANCIHAAVRPVAVEALEAAVIPAPARPANYDRCVEYAAAKWKACPDPKGLVDEYVEIIAGAPELPQAETLAAACSITTPESDGDPHCKGAAGELGELQCHPCHITSMANLGLSFYDRHERLEFCIYELFAPKLAAGRSWWGAWSDWSTTRNKYAKQVKADYAKLMEGVE